MTKNEEENYKSTTDFKINLLKTDNELFDDEQYVVHNIINVKRTIINEEETWSIILNNNQVAIVLDNLSENQKKFLRTPEGMNFLIFQYKSGKKNAAKIKKELKSRV